MCCDSFVLRETKKEIDKVDYYTRVEIRFVDPLNFVVDVVGDISIHRDFPAFNLLLQLKYNFSLLNVRVRERVYRI